MKLKESVKENLAYLGIILMIFIGGLMIANRNDSLEETQKKTEQTNSIYKEPFSQKNDFSK